jgi:hypothetical protein
LAHYEGRIIVPVYSMDITGGTVFESAHACREGIYPKTISLGSSVPLVLTYQPMVGLIFPCNHPRYENNTVLVVEGPFDALRMLTWAMNNHKVLSVAALFGTELNEEGASFLARCFHRAIVFLDRPSGTHRGNERQKALKITDKLDVFMNDRPTILDWDRIDDRGCESEATDPAELEDIAIQRTQHLLGLFGYPSV